MAPTNATRNSIHKCVRIQPGIHFNALVRESGFAPGQVQYHVRQLLDTEDVTEDRLYGRTDYYSSDYDPWERRTLALARRETAREFLFYLIENESIRPSELTERLGIARSTLAWHTDRLVDAGIVEKWYNALRKQIVGRTELALRKRSGQR
jgi:predicted transcriptional regulator